VRGKWFEINDLNHSAKDAPSCTGLSEINPYSMNYFTGHAGKFLAAFFRDSVFFYFIAISVLFVAYGGRNNSPRTYNQKYIFNL
jgi:hypothetical protein